jgi:hypothetical protein
VDGNVGPVLAEDLLTERLALYELNCLEPAHQAFGGIGEAANAGEQIQQSQGVGHGWWCCPTLAAVPKRQQPSVKPDATHCAACSGAAYLEDAMHHVAKGIVGVVVAGILIGFALLGPALKL